jgi:hypothetical protein
MEAPIEGMQLASWSVLPDGTRIAIDLVAQGNTLRRVVLPVEILSALMMTLPRMLQSALDRQFPDGSLRVVQQLGDWRLEQAEREIGLPEIGDKGRL